MIGMSMSGKRTKGKTSKKTEQKQLEWAHQLTLNSRVFVDWIQDGLEGEYHTMHFGLGEALADELNLQIQDWDLKNEIIILESHSNNHLLVSRKTAMRQVLQIFSIYFAEDRAIELNGDYFNSLKLSGRNLKTTPFIRLKFQKLDGGKYAGWEVIELDHHIGHEK